MATRSQTKSAKPAAKPRAKAAAKPAARRGAAPAEKSPMDRLQEAIRGLDRARDRAGDELRESIDTAVTRLRDVAGDLRKRAERQAGEWEDALDEAGEDVRRELGRRAVMAQQTPEALKEMSAAIRKRKAELAPQGGGKAA